jgi:sulfur carrier protein
MNIYINGKAFAIGDKANITVALTYHFTEPQRSTFAVALNGNFVGKADYDTVMLKQGDSLDVFQPIQGG